MPSAIDNYKRKIAVELERRRRCAENNMTTMTEFDIYEDDDDENDGDDDYSPIRLGGTRPPLYTPNPIIEPTDELHQTQIVLDDLDIFIIKKSRMSVERNPTSIENNLVKAYQPVIEVAPSSLLRRTPQYNFINVNIYTYISLYISSLLSYLNLGKSR